MVNPGGREPITDELIGGSDALLTVLNEMLAMKQEALRSLKQAVEVAKDALLPLSENRPLSGPAQRALVTIALMSLGQADEALEELDGVAGRVTSAPMIQER